jgi:signal peptidase I
MPKFIPNKKNDSKGIGEKLSFLKWLDPFTYVDLYVMPVIKKKTDSKIVEGIVNVFFAAVFALIVYMALGVLFGTASPLVIVYSASMEQNYYRGDVIALGSANETTFFGPEINLNSKIRNVPAESFLSTEYLSNGELEKIIFTNGEIIQPNKEGSIIVYNSYPTNLPIIHRAIVKINALDGIFILTKGDNQITNPTFDQDCGRVDEIRLATQKPCITLFAIPIEEIQGVAFAQVPKVGCVKLWLVDDLLSLVLTGKLPQDFKGVC